MVPVQRWFGAGDVNSLADPPRQPVAVPVQDLYFLGVKRMFIIVHVMVDWRSGSLMFLDSFP